MKNQIIFKGLFVTVFLLFAITQTMAQNGSVKGKVIDENHFSLPGARVFIESLKKEASSDFEGSYSIVSIPKGTYSLKVSYLGYTAYESSITIEENRTLNLTIQLAPEKLVLNEVEIESYRADGQAKALNTQKNKENIVNIISTDQIGKFPDSNIGDAVKRVPGITMQVDQGEARNIIVRGLSPQLNSVTLNGSRIPSAEGDNRNVQMDLIPTDMIQTVEVNKAVTPDMDADALGGSVNLITKTSPQKFRLSTTLGSGISFITDKRILNGSFLLGNRSKNDKLGWLVSTSFNDRDFGSDNIEAEWEDKFEYNSGDPDNLEEVNVNPYAKQVEAREYRIQRIRRSVSANLDYKIDNANALTFKSIYNWRDDREKRFAFGQEILDGEDIETGDFTIDANGNLQSFPIEATRENKQGISGGRHKSARLEDQRMQNYSLGGNHLIGSLQLDWLTSYAMASEKKDHERYVAYKSEYGIQYNNDPKKPWFTPINEADANYNAFEFDELTDETSKTSEKDINLLVNAQIPASLISGQTGTLKWGAKTRLKKKTRKNSFMEYSPLGAEMELLGDIPTLHYSDPDFLAGSQYQVGTFANPEYIGSLNLNDSSVFEAEDKPEEYLTANFNVKENIYAGFVMMNQKFSDKFSVLAGIRFENTTINSNGNEISFDPDGDFEGTNPVSVKNSYTNFLPGIHLKYNITNNTILRAAWTNTLARPNYIDLVPYKETNREKEEIYVGNPDLTPTTSMNFDMMAEHYFKSVGIISGGVFYKKIDDFIYKFQSENADGYDVFTPMNGDNASVAGAEFSFQRRLDFLPGFAKNFSIYANYTYLTSKAKGIRNEDGENRGDLDLPQSTPHMVNASVNYSTKRFSLRLSGNFSDAYLDELGKRDFEDRYYDKQFFLDFNANVSFNKNLSFYLNLNNLTNQPLRYYQGTVNRVSQLEYYGKTLNLGLKYDLY
ncbi:TonB-dependent receptor [Flavobacterium humi]|uniref:TonB-dependent receptor n=1 Tax=Flavobacterium humi TaxID=2562683 RepID=A0A4Z0LD16_9FLAO|nr:TonB-dependent receptor [Flavobacterium humi]TGD59771.1 TonB-dependent receptor [Flavobacterium humi]